MATYYWVGGTGTWSATGNTQFAATSGGVATLLNPTSADTVIFDSASGTGTCTTSAGAAAAVVTLNSSTLGLTLGANLTNSGTFTLTLGALNLISYKLTCQIFSSNNSNTRSIAFGTGDITITGNAATIFAMATATGFTHTGTSTINATYSGSTGTRTIQFGVTAGGSESIALNYNISAGADIISFGGAATSAYKSINFTGFTGSLASTGSSIFIYGNLTVSSGMTITASAGPLAFAATSGTQQITTNSVTIDRPFVFNGIGGTFAFQGALTQGSTRAFTITNGTVQLKNGVTSTVGAFATAGTNVKYLQSTVAGSSATLSQASGTVNASYLTIKDIAATGGATFNALWANNNVDAGDNSGWVFGDPPVINAVEYTYALRSLTEPRRF